MNKKNDLKSVYIDDDYEEWCENYEPDVFELCDVQDRQHLKLGEFEEIYDPGCGKMMNVDHIRKFYGNEIYEQLRKELKQSRSASSHWGKKQVSKPLFKKMKKKVAEKTPDQVKSKGNDTKMRIKPASGENEAQEKYSPGKTEARHQIQPDDYYFMKTRRGMIRNEKYRDLFKGPHTVYECLWANIVRHGWKDSEDYPIKEKYYDKGYLVYSTSISKIAEKCGMAKATVDKYLKQFANAGVLRIEHLPAPKGKKRGQSVFVLGEWKTVNGKPAEVFYREQVFMSE